MVCVRSARPESLPFPLQNTRYIGLCTLSVTCGPILALSDVRHSASSRPKLLTNLRHSWLTYTQGTREFIPLTLSQFPWVRRLYKNLYFS
jgi:hypothetical protein